MFSNWLTEPSSRRLIFKPHIYIHIQNLFLLYFDIFEPVIQSFMVWFLPKMWEAPPHSASGIGHCLMAILGEDPQPPRLATCDPEDREGSEREFGWTWGHGIVETTEMDVHTHTHIYIYIYMIPVRGSLPPPPPPHMVWSQNLRFAAFHMKTLYLQCFLHGGLLVRSATLQIRWIFATNLPKTCYLQCFGFDIVE